MKKYKITNPANGKSYSVQMETPPTPEDIEEIFASQPTMPSPSFEDSASVSAEADMSASVPFTGKTPEQLAIEKRQQEFRSQPKLEQVKQGAGAFVKGTLHGIQKLGRVLPMSDLMRPEKNPKFQEEYAKDPKSASYYVRKDDRKEFDAKKDKQIEAELQDYALASAGLGVEDIPYYSLDMLATAIPGFKGAKYASKFKYSNALKKGAAEGAAWSVPALGVHQAQAVAETGKPDYISGAVDLATGIPLSALAKPAGSGLQKSGVTSLYKNLARVPDLRSPNPLTKQNVQQAMEADMVPALGSAENVSAKATSNLKETEATVRGQRAEAAKEASFKPEKRVEMGGGIGAIRILPDNSQLVNARNMSEEELQYNLEEASPRIKKRKSTPDAEYYLKDMISKSLNKDKLANTNIQFLKNPSGEIIGGIEYSVNELGIEVSSLASLEKGRGKELLGYVEKLAKNRKLPVNLIAEPGAQSFYKEAGYNFVDETGAFPGMENPSPGSKLAPPKALMSGRTYTAKDIGLGNKDLYHGTLETWQVPITKTGISMSTGKPVTFTRELPNKIDMNKRGKLFATDKPEVADNYAMAADPGDVEAFSQSTIDNYPYRPNVRPYKLNPNAKVTVLDFTNPVNDENYPLTNDIERWIKDYPDTDVFIAKNTKDLGKGGEPGSVQDQYILTPKGKKTGAFIERYTGEMGSSLGMPTPNFPKPKSEKTISDLSPTVKLSNEQRRAIPGQAAISKVRAALEQERLDPTKNKSLSSSYEEANEALDFYKKELAKRTTSKGPHKHITVEDALSFRQAVDKEVNYRKAPNSKRALTPGFERVSAMLRKELEMLIEQAAPKVTAKTKELKDLIPVREAFEKKAQMEDVRKPAPWTAADILSVGTTRAVKSVQNNPAYGVAKYKTGKAAQGQTPQTLASFARTGTSQTDNKKKGKK